MIQAARQIVVANENGEIVIRIPEIKPGMRAEVIVLPEQGPESRPRMRKAALLGSCRGMFKSPEEANRFLSEERSGPQGLGGGEG